MGSDKRNRFLIACRYVPYDQWFLTSVSPSWKTKHLKQIIIAKALNLPFDRRLIMQDSSTARPPSPITFAPIEGMFRESNLSSGLGNYEAGESQAAYKIQRSEEGISTNEPDRNVEGAVPIVEPSYKDQIYTSIFTLIRFSTGQILEEHFLVSWYNLAPHELVELHCSSPPITFAGTLVFGHMLINGGSITVDIPTSTIHGSHEASSPTSTRSLSSLAPSTISSESRIATLSLALANPTRLTNLPRHDLACYTEPYWEGWVRVLRVIRQPDVDPLPAGGLAEMTSGHYFSPEGNLSDSGRKWKDDDGVNDRRTKRKEWKERWAVIRNGVLSLCRNRDDPTCTRLPLSALFSLCGAEYFSFSHSDNNQQSSCPPDDDNCNRPTSSHSNLAPTSRPYRTASISGTSRVATLGEIQEPEARKFLLTATSSNSPTAPRVLSPLITQLNPIRVGANANPSLLTTPIDPFFSNHNYSNTQLPIGPERSRRERAAVRELERERMQKELATKIRPDKQVGWDDLGIVFGGKSKAKSKEKEKEREEEKDRSRSGKIREEKLQKMRQNAATGSLRQPLIGEGGLEKDSRDRQGGTNRQREKLQDQQAPFFYPDDRCIPASREEAIAKGMLIVCARFRVGSVEDAGKPRNKDKSALSLLRDIGSGAPLASNEGYEPGSKGGWSQEDRRLERNAESQRLQVLEGSPAMKSLPSRKSLPGLGHGLTMLSSGGSITPSGSIFGGFFGHKDKDKVEKNDKYGSDEEEKSKGDSIRSPYTGQATLRGKSDDQGGPSIRPPGMNDLKGVNCSADTILERDGGVLPAFHLPDYADDCRFDERNAMPDDRGAGDNKQGGHSGRRTKNEDKVELVVLDMGTEVAYNSFLRILHRNFPPPIQSSFVQMSVSTLQPPSPQQDIHGVPLALPYPEWRRDLVLRARSEGMREVGRPLELALYDRQTPVATPGQERREDKSQTESEVEEYSGGQNASKRRASETDLVADNDPMGHDNTFGMDYLMLDDSDNESEDESARWWQDIPRQFSEEKHDFECSTTGRAKECMSSSRDMLSTVPCTFSRSPSVFSEPTPVPALDMEERLRPSISSSTLASSATSSSRSTAFGASPPLKSSIMSLISNEEIPGQYSPESYQSRSYPRRIVSPSQTLSSPSSNESLASYLYHRPAPQRPVLPNSDFYLPPTSKSSGSASVLHHSASMPNARSMPSSGGGIQTDLNRDRTVTASTNSQNPIHQPEAHVRDVQLSSNDDPLSHDIFSASIDLLDKPILTLAQINEIETDTESMIDRASVHHTSSLGTPYDTKRNISTHALNESVPSSSFQLEQLANNGYEKVGDEQDYHREQLQRFGRDGSVGRSTNTTRSNPSSYSFRDYSAPPTLSSVLDSASAQAILRRVRSGSSLQTPMEVHFEEFEEDGAEI